MVPISEVCSPPLASQTLVKVCNDFVVAPDLIALQRTRYHAIKTHEYATST